MKSIYTKLLASVMLLAASAGLAYGQTYPYTTPTYIPTAIAAPVTYTTTGDYVYVASGISTVTIRVSGTCTSLVSAPQGTNDGTNWTTIQAIPVVGGANITSITAPGFWRVNTAGFSKTRLHITVLSASCTVAMAGTAAPGALYLQNPNTTSNPTTITDVTGTYNLAVDSSGIGSVKVTNGTSTVGVTAASTAPVAATPALVVAQSPNGDPCTLPTVTKSSAVINISSATTTKIVALSSGKITYVCGFNASVAGTNPTVLFKYGTNVSGECDTGATSLSGTYAPTAGTVLNMSQDRTIMQTAASKDLCITTGGTPSVQGILTYVQQ